MPVQNLPFVNRATAATATGEPLPGALIYTYEQGTTTPLTTYVSDSLTTPHPNPIVANSAAQFGPIYTDGLTAVKLVIQTAGGTTVSTVDECPMVHSEDGVGHVDFDNNAIRFFQASTNNPGSGNTTLGMAFGNLGGMFASSTSNTLLTLNRNTDGIVASFRTSGTQRGSISISGSTTTYATTSDAQLKEDLGEMDLATATQVIALMQLHDYRWHETGEAGQGVFAQELHLIYPAAVVPGRWQDGEWMPWMVDYSKLIPVIGRVLQGVLTRLDALEAAP